MHLEKSNRVERIAEKIGFLLSYLVFTMILFVILNLVDKIPAHWSLVHIAGITVMITAVGYGLRKVLE